jgi:hypothetical protein
MVAKRSEPEYRLALREEALLLVIEALRGEWVVREIISSHGERSPQR